VEKLEELTCTIIFITGSQFGEMGFAIFQGQFEALNKVIFTCIKFPHNFIHSALSNGARKMPIRIHMKKLCLLEVDLSSLTTIVGENVVSALLLMPKRISMCGQ